MNHRLLVSTLLFLALPGRAYAITCSFVSVAGASFGVYDVFNPTPLDTTATTTIVCTGVLGTDNLTVELSQGGAGSFSPRQMARTGGGTLDYNLFLDPGRSTIFGDGSSGTGRVGPLNPPDGTDLAISVYGRAPAQQDVRSGAYADTVTVTITY
jgi:spore coat protein U-like protein